MKHILLAGYGNIAKAFEKIMREQETEGSFSLNVCDLTDGNDIMKFLPLHIKDFDLVINTSLANSIELSKMCIDYGLDYIDVGIEDGIDQMDSTPSDYTTLVKEMTAWETHSRIMLGFGVNPGILEHVYQKYKPQDRHYAFELEHDDSVSDQHEVFATWSPFMYAEEAVFAEKVVVTPQGTRGVDERLKTDGGALTLNYHGRQRHYLPIHHEELLSMQLSCPDLLGSAYLFQAPVNMQEYFLRKGADLSKEQIFSIPVPQDLQGEDHIGMLFWDTKERIYWVKNVTTNQTTWKRYGINAVCWQTGVGIWIAYRLLDAVSTDHPHTMTELSQLMPDTIDKLLRQIGFTLETEEQPFQLEEFRQNIMSYFPD